ncbi:uncharacterized protein LTR77_003065 [Saxophila tyrrhenica]|uniref:J domain-containing protein n=1 Tax=Saxophila tyrrhenica TaxID=1690608 RepID=A0AAV9PKL4_9PEZI|nr:hypothetical protein LTR77_003065 [Saxophila tyrrhenica]
MSFRAMATQANAALELSSELPMRIDDLQAQTTAGQQADVEKNPALYQEYGLIQGDLILRIKQLQAQEQLNSAGQTTLQALKNRLLILDVQMASLTRHSSPQSGELGAGASKSMAGGSVTAHGCGWKGSADHLMPPESGDFPADAESSTTVGDGQVPAGSLADIIPLPVIPKPPPQVSEGSEAVSETPALRSSWPLLYRIMDLDPKTPDGVFDKELKRCLKALFDRHYPGEWPNDRWAPGRWEACEKAYRILAEPASRQLYDDDGEVPSSLKGYDATQLHGRHVARGLSHMV